MTFQLPRLLHISFSTFYACQSVLFLYLATSFAKKRAVTKHLTSKFCFVQHFLIKIQLTRFMVKCAKVEEAARSYLECTLGTRRILLTKYEPLKSNSGKIALFNLSRLSRQSLFLLYEYQFSCKIGCTSENLQPQFWNPNKAPDLS